MMSRILYTIRDMFSIQTSEFSLYYFQNLDVHSESEQSLAEKMVGRKVKLLVDKSKACPGETVFEIENLSVRCERGVERVKNLSMSLRRGEIYGLADRKSVV